MKFVNRPIKKLISGTEHIANADYEYHIESDRDDEIGQLARAIHRMGGQIADKEKEIMAF